MNDTIKISVVSYLNSKPFIYGLKQYSGEHKIHVELDIPAICADKLQKGNVDIGLVPVAVIPELKQYRIISNYCIGADGSVETVMLYSEVPLNKIKRIFLDYQSRTSVALIRILAKNFWNINPEWVLGKQGYEKQVSSSDAALVIGDRTFKMNGKFGFQYDLSEEWKKYTELPFVFACWVANKPLPEKFISSFDEALKRGVNNIEEVAGAENYTPEINVKNYLTQKIDYRLDQLKHEAMEKFWRLIK